MVVLAWIAQLLLFFIFWRLAYFVTMRAQQQVTVTSLWVELVVNLVVAVVLLIVVSSLHSAWWLMTIIGAILGIFTAQAAKRNQAK